MERKFASTATLRSKLSNENVCVQEEFGRPNNTIGWATIAIHENRDGLALFQARVTKSPDDVSKPTKASMLSVWSLQTRFAQANDTEIATEPQDLLTMSAGWLRLNANDKLEQHEIDTAIKSITVAKEFGLAGGSMDFSGNSDIEPELLQQLQEIERELVDPLVEARTALPNN